MLARALQKPLLGWNTSCLSPYSFENFSILFSVCFLMEVLYAVVLHANSMGTACLQVKTVVQYSVATEVLKANMTAHVDDS